MLTLGAIGNDFESTALRGLRLNLTTIERIDNYLARSFSSDNAKEEICTIECTS
jgi:hypothetical protein